MFAGSGIGNNVEDRLFPSRSGAGLGHSFDVLRNSAVLSSWSQESTNHGRQHGLSLEDYMDQACPPFTRGAVCAPKRPEDRTGNRALPNFRRRVGLVHMGGDSSVRLEEMLEGLRLDCLLTAQTHSTGCRRWNALDRGHTSVRRLVDALPP